MAERRGHWPDLWRLTWMWQPRKPDLWASLEGKGWAGAAGALSELGNPSQHLVTCIPLGSQAGGTASPFPWLLASCQCPSGKAPLEGHCGGEGFSGDSPWEMLVTSCPVSPWEGLTCKAVPSLKLPCNFSTFLKSRFVPAILE